MNKKLLIILGSILIIISACIIFKNSQTNSVSTDKDRVKTVVENFGTKLQSVSINAPIEIAASEIKENYKEFLDENLLNKWMDNPTQALGRVTSSPWPDKIEVKNIEQISENEYVVFGDIIEKTSAEDFINKENIQLSLKKIENDWKIVDIIWGRLVFSNEFVSFLYPNISAAYISTSKWPPSITITEQPFVCEETPQADSFNKRVTKKNINGMDYCIKLKSEGAAGSTYTDYSYTFLKDDRLVTLNFVLRYPNCTNYDDPKMTTCSQERETFSIDDIVSEIVESIKIESLLTLIGEHVCLPHKNTEGPQTQECAFGLKVGDSTYYALNIGENMGTLSEIKTGDYVEVKGIQVNDYSAWDKYNVEGAVLVESIIKLDFFN